MTPESEQGSTSTRAAWDRHYRRSRSAQEYPDENLLRLLKKIPPGPALDFGCGSGRHLKLLDELGFAPLYGADTSDGALELTRALLPELPEGHLFHLTNSSPFPLAPDSLGVVVLWGVLHYNSDDVVGQILGEALRLLKPGGFLLGTLRARGESHFSANPDLEGASLRLFSAEEARGLLGGYFPGVELGYMERTPVGELERRICHWIFRARKSEE